jgi:hypothetical protein
LPGLEDGKMTFLDGVRFGGPGELVVGFCKDGLKLVKNFFLEAVLII